MEDQARKDLEREGCPPCYPLDLSFSQDIPKSYQRIIDYWKSLPGTGDVVLCAQLSDWKQFRGSQRASRRNRDLAAQVQKRRKPHQTEDDVHLRPSLERQSRLKTWGEFQAYHLCFHESLEKRRQDLKLAVARREVEGPEDESEEAPLLQMLQANEKKLERHGDLLKWIEQERLKMVAMLPFSCRDGESGGTVTASRRRSCRKVPPRQTLGNVRVSKSEHPKQTRKTAKTRAALRTTVRETSSAADVTSTNPQAREEQLSSNKGAVLSPVRPRRDLNHAKSTTAIAKSQSAPPRRTTTQRPVLGRAPPKGLQAVRLPRPEVVLRTRSGRISRKPDKWRPDIW